MSTASLLGQAAHHPLVAALFVCFAVASLFIRSRTRAEVEPLKEVRAAFDEMLVRKGLLTGAQLRLIRHGTRSRGVVTGMRATGASREDHREVVLDVMVRKPGGGQFPAHETALIPAVSLAKVSPGSVIDAYYRAGDESAVAVCVTPP
jgi:hypothetical protein